MGRPGGIRWARATQLEPLELPFAKSLFLSIAPERFDAPGLDELLEDMGGIPLAIELLAHAAEVSPVWIGLRGAGEMSACGYSPLSSVRCS
ncbi:MAG: hypothetical protein ACLP0J_08425 [Solirubrobacteraceae bacterium]